MTRRRRFRSGGGSWFLAGATIVVLALLGVTALAIVDAVRSDDPDSETGRLQVASAGAADAASPTDDAEAAAARAREFYQLLVEHRLAEAAALATGDAGARVLALQAQGREERTQDPVLAGIVDETTRGVLDSFEVIDPAHRTGVDTVELSARAVVEIAETRKTVEVWFSLQKDALGWRVGRYLPGKGE